MITHSKLHKSLLIQLMKVNGQVHFLRIWYFDHIQFSHHRVITRLLWRFNISLIIPVQMSDAGCSAWCHFWRKYVSTQYPDPQNLATTSFFSGCHLISVPMGFSGQPFNTKPLNWSDFHWYV